MYSYTLIVKTRIHYIFIALLAFVSACSTDLSVIGEYEETMVIYGLLDQSQPKQYIKINKAFLGEGSAIEYAQIKDSSQYVNSLNVVLKRIKNGVELSSFTLSPDNTISKDPGAFYGPDQANAIYSFSSPAGTLNTDSQYELVVTNTQTGVTASAQTNLILSAKPTSILSPFSAPAETTPFFNFVLPNNDDYNYPVRWISGKNARIYQLVVRLNYVDSTTSGNITQKLDWLFPAQKTQGLGGGENMRNDFLGQGFMQFVGNQLEPYSGLEARKALQVELLLMAGGDDLSTFIDVNKPSTGIVQERPEYTNISNGLGVFSTRFNEIPFIKKMSQITTDSLACGQYTQHLKFLKFNGSDCQ